MLNTPKLIMVLECIINSNGSVQLLKVKPIQIELIADMQHIVVFCIIVINTCYHSRLQRY